MASVVTNVGALMSQKFLRATSMELTSVQTHVSSILAKLGFGSRIEIAREVERHRP